MILAATFRKYDYDLEISLIVDEGKTFRVKIESE